jgi:hypothetical protein
MLVLPNDEEKRDICIDLICFCLVCAVCAGIDFRDPGVRAYIIRRNDRKQNP